MHAASHIASYSSLLELCETHTSWVAYHNQSSTLAVILILDFMTIDSCVHQLIAVQYICPSIPYAWSHVAHDTLHLSFFASLYTLLFVGILSLVLHQVSCKVSFGFMACGLLQLACSVWLNLHVLNLIHVYFLSTLCSPMSKSLSSFTGNTSILGDSLHDSTFSPLPKTMYFLIHLPILLWTVLPKAIRFKCALNAPGAGLFVWAHTAIFARAARLWLGWNRFLPRAISRKRALCSPGANLHTLPAGVMLSFWDALKL